jgi:mannose-6-phosphate isomerase
MECILRAGEDRPWGRFDVLEEGHGFKVKRISVKPGGRLSLQSHKHRAEHWTVVSGTATVTVGETVKAMTRAQSIDIPLGAKHRLENLHDDVVEIIEVQFGDYLGEDDIIRYDDAYART